MFWRSALSAGRGRRKVIDDRVRPCIADQVKVFIVVYYGHQVLFYVPAVTKDDDIFLIPEFRHHLPDHGSGKLQFGAFFFLPHAVAKRDVKVGYPVFIPASNEPSGCLQTFGDCREGQIPRCLQRGL